MLLEELDRRYAAASWMINKRTAMAAVKSLLIGWENLEKLTTRIADEYELSEEDRRRLRPTKSIDAIETLGEVANNVKPVAAIKSAKDAFDLAKKAQSAGRLARSVKVLATHGPKAAASMAKTGRVVGKANPVIMIVNGIYAVGTTGWFGYKARSYNLACYDLLKSRIIDPAPIQ